MHRSAFIRLLACCAILLSATSFVASNADGPRPGLPLHLPGPDGGGYDQVIQGGAAEARKSKQWARIPMQVTTVWTILERIPLEPGDPRQQHRRATNYAYLMAESGAPHNYGLTAPFTVNTVAFGNVPASATLRMAQRRGSDGLPRPITVTALDELYAPGQEPAGWPGRLRYFDTEVSDSIDIEVLELTVAGEDLELRPGCRTSRPAELELFGRGFIEGTPGINTAAPWLSGHFAPAAGGLLSGKVDVPGFSGCYTKGGEDISAILTATVSGSDNAVSLHVTGPFIGCTAQRIPPVGEYDATRLCPTKIPGTVNLPPVDH